MRVFRAATEAGGQDQRATVVHIRVVFPREADAAVHLDAILRAALGRDGCQRGDVLAGLVDRAGGIPDGRGGPLGVGDHLGALVLDGLELTDRPAELFADLGVVRGRVGGPSRDADGLGRQQRRDQRTRSDHTQVAQHGIVVDFDGVGAHMRDRPQRIDAGDRFDLELVRAQHNPLFAAVDRHGQHQQRRLTRCRHRADFTADNQGFFFGAMPRGGQPGVQGVRGDGRSRSKVVEHLGIRVVRRDQRTGDRRRHERAGYRAVAELGEHHGELENPETLPANGFGQVHALQALFGRGLPKRRRVFDRCFQRGVQHLGWRHPRHQGPHRIGQVLMLRSDCDRHWSPSLVFPGPVTARPPI